MNTMQIDDLAACAWRYANNYTGPDVMPVIQRFHRKLAELVIRECAQVVNNNDYAGSTLGNRLLFDYYGIKDDPHG